MLLPFFLEVKRTAARAFEALWQGGLFGQAGFRVFLLRGFPGKAGYGLLGQAGYAPNSCIRLMYLPKMSNSMFTCVPGRMAWKLVCS